MKLCNKCKIEKESKEFFKDRHKKDGLTTFCKSCKMESIAKYKTEHDQEIKEWQAKYFIENKHKLKTDQKRYYKENYERIKIRGRNNEAARNARKVNATPKWLNKEQKQEIREFYKNCPKGYQVDHIIPLRGKNVTGLHVIWNLQYLTATENLKKGNRVAI